MTSGTACGKTILFGEHAVVYGQPALGVPVSQLRAQAQVSPAEAGAGVTIVAPDVRREIRLAEAPADDALAVVVRLTLEWLGVDSADLLIGSSDFARGTGLGAALPSRSPRARPWRCTSPAPPSRRRSRHRLRGREVYHGTPGGIDNSVIAWSSRSTSPRAGRPRCWACRIRSPSSWPNSGIHPAAPARWWPACASAGRRTAGSTTHLRRDRRDRLTPAGGPCRPAIGAHGDADARPTRRSSAQDRRLLTELERLVEGRPGRRRVRGQALRRRPWRPTSWRWPRSANAGGVGTALLAAGAAAIIITSSAMRKT